MKIINKLRVLLFNSSQGAFNLAKRNDIYLPMAKRIISVKNNDVLIKLADGSVSLKELAKKEKYENMLAAIETRLEERDAFFKRCEIYVYGDIKSVKPVQSSNFILYNPGIDRLI